MVREALEIDQEKYVLFEYQGSSHSRYHRAIDQSNNREEKDEGTVHTDCTLMMMLFDLSH